MTPYKQRTFIGSNFSKVELESKVSLSDTLVGSRGFFARLLFKIACRIANLEFNSIFVSLNGEKEL